MHAHCELGDHSGASSVTSAVQRDPRSPAFSIRKSFNAVHLTMREPQSPQPTHRANALGYEMGDSRPPRSTVEMIARHRSVIGGSIARCWIFIFAWRTTGAVPLGCGFRRTGCRIDTCDRANGCLRNGQTQPIQRYCRPQLAALVQSKGSTLPHFLEAPKKLKGADEEDLTRTFVVKTHYLYT